MKNNIRLHFGSVTGVSANAVGERADSGNGYYSYSYYLLPYTGKMCPKALAAVNSHLFKKHYSPPFVSFGSARVHGEDETGGVLLVSTTYHHGD